MRTRFYSVFILLALAACSGNKESQSDQKPETVQKNVQVPVFNADSAYQYVAKQVEFGPRVPNTTAHKNTSEWLQKQFRRFGASVTIQEFESATYDGHQVSLTNITASFFPEKKKRIMLASHWDTRPFADRDEENPNASFDGANDGASGVGVLLELARQLSISNPPDVGIDIVLFDGEDWGYDGEHAQRSPDPKPAGLQSWWCLGSQYWAKHKGNYTAFYGVLLDMVGGKDSRFAYEENSLNYAAGIVDKIWKTAARIGHSDRFITRRMGEITDDHVFVNEVAKIPMADIISYDPATEGFGDFHHTTKDNMEIISTETLRAIGETLMTVIYYE